jgi:hypothetical protein
VMRGAGECTGTTAQTEQVSHPAGAHLHLGSVEMRQRCTNKHELEVGLARNCVQERSSQGQVQHRSLIDQQLVAVQRVAGIVQELGRLVLRHTRFTLSGSCNGIARRASNIWRILSAPSRVFCVATSVPSLVLSLTSASPSACDLLPRTLHGQQPSSRIPNTSILAISTYLAWQHLVSKDATTSYISRRWMVEAWTRAVLAKRSAARPTVQHSPLSCCHARLVFCGNT